MGQPFMPLPSFSNFTKISSPFFQCAMHSSTDSFEKSEWQEDELPHDGRGSDLDLGGSLAMRD